MTVEVQVIEKDIVEKINKILEVYNDHLKKIRLGTIDTDFFDFITIKAKGKTLSLKNLCIISIDDEIVIIKPNDTSLIKEIEKSINHYKKDIPFKFSIISEKNQILLKFDLTITQELRNTFVTVCNRKSEEFRVSLRVLRQDGLKKIKSFIKNEEEFKRNTKNLQLQFDKANKTIDDKEKIKINSLLKD